MPSTLTVIFVSLVALCVVAGAVRLPTLAEQLTFKLRASTNASDFGDLSKKDVAFSQCCAEKGVFAGIDEIDDKTATGQVKHKIGLVDPGIVLIGSRKGHIGPRKGLVDP